jgi:hypothetical protein
MRIDCLGVKGGSAMRYNDNVYVGRVAGFLAGYFSMLGYPDAWKLGAAEVAARNWNWQLAREALELFCYEREFYGMEAEALNYLSKLVAGEEVVSYSDEYVELQELQEEELPL